MNSDLSSIPHLHNGLFVGGAVLDCKPDSGEPENLISIDLGIYWEDKVWIIIPCNEFFEKIYLGITFETFTGRKKWIDKIIPLKWLEGKLLLYAKMPLLKPHGNFPVINPFFPVVTQEFMTQLDNNRSNFFEDYEDRLKFDYFSIQ